MAAPSRKNRKPLKNRKTKTFLQFDEKARSDYLRGFQKRKNERRQIAREKNDERIKEERKALIRQFREQKKSKEAADSDIIPEIKHLVDPQVYNLPEHTVTIADFGDIDFVGNTGLRLGKNSGDVDGQDEVKDSAAEGQSKISNFSEKSFRQQLGACSNRLSSQKIKSKKANKKHHMKSKSKMKKKGKKGGKRK